MSMEVNGSYGNGTPYTSTVELKTPTPGVTRTEEIKTGYHNVNDYSEYLQGKYSYMNTGTTSMQGIPTTVSVSGAFLKKCMNDPEKAKYLEENLAAIPDCVKSLANFTKTMPGSPVCTYATYMIGEDGNITIMSGCTNDPDGKIARENAERKIKEKKVAEGKLAKKRAEKKAEEQKAAERRRESRAGKNEKEHSIIIRGNDVRSMTWNLVDRWNSSHAIDGISPSGFDLKA